MAFICDGNSRWAQQRDLPSSLGHAKGAEVVRNTLRHLRKRGVRICTFYGFSTENWSRSDEEISDIFNAMERTAKGFRAKAVEENVRVRILGDLDDDRIPSTLREALRKLEKDTGGRGAGGRRAGDKRANEHAHDRRNWQEHNHTTTGSSAHDHKTTDSHNHTTRLAPTVTPTRTHITLCIAVNYGGRTDIVSASRRMAEMVQSGELSPEDIDQDTFGKYLGTSGVPNPDLIVRTGGEQRVSNFLLWDLAYSELFFTNVLWPDFGPNNADDALAWYTGVDRRFGGRRRPHSPVDTSGSDSVTD